MDRKILSTFFAAMISASLITPSMSYAQNGLNLHSRQCYNNGYDDGYEDGYDDAMEDCPCPPRIGILGGYYVGFGGGYEGFQINRNPSIDNDRIGTFTTHANGWNGRIFGGLGKYFFT
ncbi:MAG: hypothetical protein ACD_46C00642G0001, partial [uncultured bacterium]